MAPTPLAKLRPLPLSSALVKIEKDRVVALQYVLSTSSGEVIEDSSKRGAPLRFVFGYSPLLPGIEKHLEGLEKGQEKDITLSPAEAFGTEDSGVEGQMGRAEFPASAKIAAGLKFEANLPDGGGPVRIVVTEVDSEVVKVRYQHPLAGQPIKAKVKVVDVRNATPTEMLTGEVEVPPPMPPGMKK